ECTTSRPRRRRSQWPVNMSHRAILAAFLATALLAARAIAAEPSKPETEIFARQNLVAWCIVPFDAKKRTPEQRAEMLDRIGIHRFAYDWRDEHLPTFEAELAALKKHAIELTAVWF